MTITTKKVNVRAQMPVTGLKHPIAGVVNGITLTTNEILICLHGKAKVHEVIGTRLVPLDFVNYASDNSAKPVKAEEVVAAKVIDVREVNGKLAIVETPAAAVEAPVVETTQAEEAVVETPVVTEASKVEVVADTTETTQAEEVVTETPAAAVEAPVVEKNTGKYQKQQRQ